MGRPSNLERLIMERVNATREAEERAERMQREKLDRIAEAGPPAGSRVDPEAWRSWFQRGYIVCPASALDHTCGDSECAIGVLCRKRGALGLYGNGSPLPPKLRPACQAKTRAGGSCAVKVEPGKRRCRFHGGKSTGPKSAEGRARIAEAQRRRWAATRKVEEVTPARAPRQPVLQKTSVSETDAARGRIDRWPLQEPSAHEDIAAAVAGIPRANAPDWIERRAPLEERFFDAGDDMIDSDYNPYG